jgi:hypothetical protein
MAQQAALRTRYKIERQLMIGIRTPIVSRLAVATNGTFSFLGKTSVRAAGKNAVINCSAESVILETRRSICETFEI